MSMSTALLRKICYLVHKNMNIMESIHRYMIIKDDKNNAADKLTDL